MTEPAVSTPVAPAVVEGMPLPSRRALLKATIVALVAAIAILFVIVLPAEYGYDPTGLGRPLGLAEMGEIKMRLAREAAADH